MQIEEKLRCDNKSDTCHARGRERKKRQEERKRKNRPIVGKDTVRCFNLT